MKKGMLTRRGTFRVDDALLVVVRLLILAHHANLTLLHAHDDHLKSIALVLHGFNCSVTRQ